MRTLHWKYIGKPKHMNKNTMKLNITLTISFIFFKCAFKLKRHVHFECQLYFSLCKREIQLRTYFSTALRDPALVYYDVFFMIFQVYVYVTKQASVLTRTLKGPKSLKSVVRVWNGPRCPYHLIRVVCLSERQSFSSYSERQRGLMLNLWCHCSLLWALMSPLNEREVTPSV